MESKLKINLKKCSACGLCKSVCIRNNIAIEKTAVELESNCFECGHCMAICPNHAINLKSFDVSKIEEYDVNIPLDYDDLLQLLKQRRSIRWFKNKKIDEKTFNKLFIGAYYSPSAQNIQDVEFVVIDNELDEFMQHVYDIIKVQKDKFFRIKEFGEYLKDKNSYSYHPLLWEGKQLILTFSSDKSTAIIANTRFELLAYSLGLGGFYSLFISKADEIDHNKLMRFFPEISPKKHMCSAFIIGYPKIYFKRTIPRKNIKVTYK